MIAHLASFIRQGGKQNPAQDNQIIYPYRKLHNLVVERKIAKSVTISGPIKHHQRTLTVSRSRMNTNESSSPQKESILKPPQKSSKQNLSPEHKSLFRHRLKLLDRSIQQLRSRQEHENDENVPRMLENIKLTIQRQQTIQGRAKVEKKILPVIDNQLVSEAFGSLTEQRKIQRQKFKESSFYQGSRWQKVKEGLLSKFQRSIPKHQQKYETQSIKIPFLRDGSKVLYRSIRQHNYLLASKLLSVNRFLIHEIDESMQSPLHLACAQGNCELAKLLIRFGADISAVDKNSKTPLYYALLSENSRIVELLVKSEVYIWSTENCNYSLFESNHNIFKLIRIGRRIQTVLLLTLKHQRKDLRRYLYDQQEFMLPKNVLE